MAYLRQLRYFYQKDEISQKVKDIKARLMELLQMVRVRVRGGLRDYIKQLLAEDS